MKKVRKQKIDMEMANCRVLNESAPGAKWSRHVMLPDDPVKDSSFSCSSRHTSISAQVSKAKGRDRGQDVAMVIAEGEQNVVGVFDGYGELGDDIPVELAFSMCKLWSLRSDTVNTSEAAKAFFHDSAMLTSRKLMEIYQVEEEAPENPETTPIDSPYIKNRPYGGTTAILVFMFPGGRFVVSGVGDSACYVVRPDGEIARMFTHNTIASRDWTGEDSLHRIAMGAKEYATRRNILTHSVTLGGVSTVEIDEGKLEKGGMLILASDGITKNLTVMTDENGNVRETSGCEDIGKIVSGKKGAEAADAIMKTVRERISYPSGKEKLVQMPDNRVLLPAADDTSLIVVQRIT